MDGIKFDSDKPRYDLIDPFALEGMAKVLTLGSIKYADDNWKKVEGGKERYYSALIRHLEARRMGQKYDKETGLLHAYHIMSNGMFLAWLDKEEELPYQEIDMEEKCANCGSKNFLLDISNHELRRLTMTGGFFKPVYWICLDCYENKLGIKGK